MHIGSIDTHPAPVSFYPSLKDIYGFNELALKIGPTYFRAICDELCGTSVPVQERLPDWKIEQNIRSGKIPETVVSHKNITPFSRVWNFDRVGQPDSSANIVIKAPNSGTAVEQMMDVLMASLKIANVRIIQQIPPQYVFFTHSNGLDDSTDALVKVLCENPKAHLITFSQSGVPGTVATAWMFQNSQYKGLEPASLIVVASPINAEIAPDSMNWMATHTQGEPAYIHVGPFYRGAGRLILPGTVPELYFEKAPGESRANMKKQALPAEHIRDTLQRVFREFWLPRERYRFHGQLIDTKAISCAVKTFAGGIDRICPPPQTHDLQRLTPNARFKSAKTLPNKGHYQMVGEEVLKRDIIPDVAEAIRTMSKNYVAGFYFAA